MKPSEHHLKDGGTLLIREAAVEDAGAVLAYIENICGESDFLRFGPGEFELPETEEAEFLRKHHESVNQIYILGLMEDSVISTLNFSSDPRPRIQHSGEFGMTVCKKYWGQGIGSLMIDTLITWAKENDIVKKINLRVRTDNKRAILLYERKGFINEGTIRKEIFINGAFFDHHCMGLEL